MELDSAKNMAPEQQGEWSLWKQLAFWRQLVFVLAVVIILVFFQDQPVADYACFFMLAAGLINDLRATGQRLERVSGILGMLICIAACLAYFFRGDDLLGIGYAVLAAAHSLVVVITWRKLGELRRQRAAQFDRAADALRNVYDDSS